MGHRLVIRGFVPLFVMVQPVYVSANGREQITFHAFTAEGIRSRTFARPNALAQWDVLRRWDDGEPQPWSAPFPYDGETPEQTRAWHEREHQWTLVDAEIAS